jgi:predicted nucleotidyltransferase
VDTILYQRLLEVLNDHPDIRFAILFGSLATEGGATESDLDLAVDTGCPMDSASKMALISELADRIGRPVDLVDLRTVGEPLLSQILRYGRKIRGTNTQYAELIRKHVFDEADFLRYRNHMIAQRRRTWIGI